MSVTIKLWTLQHSFHVDAAHFLGQLPPEHKCRHMHGHTWKFTVYVQTQTLDSNDFVLDFKLLKCICENEIVSKLDHQVINDMVPVPTCENLANWAYAAIKQPLNECAPNAVLLSVQVTENLRDENSVSYMEMEVSDGEEVQNS